MEGPSLVLLREELQPFLGQKVLKIRGNSKQPIATLKNRILSRVETWGKVLFLTFSSAKKGEPPLLTKTHFMMFGSYRIDAPKPNRDPRVQFDFQNGTLYFYACSFLIGADAYFDQLDQKVDLLSPEWSSRHVLKKMAEKENAHLCDLLLDQALFAGSGNIVKNEVLFNLRLNPLTKLKQIDRKDWPKLVRAVHGYCENFYEWKKRFELRRHWQTYRQWYCPLCRSKLVREKDGKLGRKSFFCPVHQRPLPPSKKIGVLKVHRVLPMKAVKTKEKRLDH